MLPLPALWASVLAAAGSFPAGAASASAWRRQSVPTFTPRLGRDSAGDELAEEDAVDDGGDGLPQPQLAPPFWPRPGRRAPPTRGAAPPTS
nr:PK-like protein [Locusta migratoria]